MKRYLSFLLVLGCAAGGYGQTPRAPVTPAPSMDDWRALADRLSRQGTYDPAASAKEFNHVYNGTEQTSHEADTAAVTGDLTMAGHEKWVLKGDDWEIEQWLFALSPDGRVTVIHRTTFDVKGPSSNPPRPDIDYPTSMDDPQAIAELKGLFQRLSQFQPG
jgi:hypothetical protein